MDFYNLGSGLTDIDATLVKTGYIITDDINTESGNLYLNNNNLTAVNLINGYDLDIFNSNIVYSSNTAYYTSNIAYPTSNMSYALSNKFHSAFGVQSDTLQLLKTFTTAYNLTLAGLAQCSNLNVNNTLIKVNGSNLVDTDKKIDYKQWIKNGPTFSQDNTLAAAALGLGALGAVAAGMALSVAGRNMFTSAGDIAQGLGDSIGNLFDNDDEGGSGGTGNTASGAASSNTSTKQYVSFKNLKTIPKTLAYDRPNSITLPGGVEVELGSGLLAFRDHVYVSSAKKLYAISSLNFSYDASKKSYSFDNSSDPIGKSTVMDFSTKTAYFNTLQSASTPNTYTLNSTGLTANQVRVGEFYVTPNGIFLGNPQNVLTSVQIIDANGKYLGPIGLSQIIDLESLNFNRIGTGTIVYDTVSAGFTSSGTGATINSFANFWNNPPLFNGTG